MDLPRGSEVIVPPFTMSATVSAVCMAGLQPVFADLDADLFTLTEATVEPHITERTSGIVVVHLFGQMAPMEPLRRLAKRHGLRILEDAAQAPAATQDGQWPGRGTAGAVFSFNQNKTITCGEGGLLATDDPCVLERAQLVRNHAESAVHAHPAIDGTGLLGWNYRLTELEASVAAAQTEKLAQLNDWRVALAERLAARLAEVPGLAPPRVHVGNRHVYFLFAVRFDSETWGCDRAYFTAALAAEGVPCTGGYVPPLYRLPLFGPEPDAGRDPARFEVCERLAHDELVLTPVCRWPVTDDDIDQVADAVEKLWEHRRELASAPPSA